MRGRQREKRQHRGAGEMSPFRAPAQAHSKEAGKWAPKTVSPRRGGGAARGEVPIPSHIRSPHLHPCRSKGTAWPAVAWLVGPGGSSPALVQTRHGVDFRISPRCPPLLLLRSRHRPSGTRGSGQRPPTGNSAAGARVPHCPAPPRSRATPAPCHQQTARRGGRRERTPGRRPRPRSAPPHLPLPSASFEDAQVTGASDRRPCAPRLLSCHCLEVRRGKLPYANTPFTWSSSLRVPHLQ